MQHNEYLFPHRLTRRDFCRFSVTAAASLAFSTPVLAQDRKTAVRIGSGHHTYELVEEWGVLPSGMKYGFGCAVVVDSRDRVYVTSRSTSPCVAIFDRRGKLLETWSKELADHIGYTTDQIKATAHGLYWSREKGKEYLYWTENNWVDKSAGNKLYGCRVYKTDLKGKVLFTLGNVEKETAASARFKFDNPTDVAVAPGGDVYIVDGYGSQLVHRFSNDFKLIKTIGGRGKENGKFNTCHGIWINTLKRGEPEVYIADRHNDRVEVYSLELEYRRTLKGNVRNPCCFYQHQGHLFIPDLASRVTIFDAQDNLVAHLGDGKGVKDNARDPSVFAAPHAMCVDSRGDFYVVEWVDFGRLRKFKHTPQRA